MSGEKTTPDMSFEKKLAGYKALIDTDISKYSKEVHKTTLEKYGEKSCVETDAFLAILNRGGKRIRGSLTILGYEMLGGQDRQMITEAARAIEILQAYILIVDDIQDRSPIRRGGASAHIQLANYHKANKFTGIPEHFGISIALNSAIAGAHAANVILTNLQTDLESKIKVIEIVNETMMITAHGQTKDIFNEVVAEVSEEEVDSVSELKTAHYTILNPLSVGMVLAGGGSKDIGSITEYSMHTGHAYELTDDILGIFGSKSESGKSPLDDIKEGKRTALTVFALNHANETDRIFLAQMLGNSNISPAEFEQTKNIIESSGALKHAQIKTNEHIAEAITSLGTYPKNWSSDGIEFLKDLALSLINRKY